MGTVYEVEHVDTSERFALKVLLGHGPPTAATATRFKREVRAPAHVDSEHLVQIIEADTAPELDGALFFVMELLEGADLEELSNGAIQPPGEVIEWLRRPPASSTRRMDSASCTAT